MIFLVPMIIPSCKSPAISHFFSQSNEKEIRPLIDSYPKLDWQGKIKRIKKLSTYLKSSNKKRIVELYMKALQDPHGAVRMEVLKSLSHVHSQEIMEEIEEVALKDKSANVRWQAYELLAQWEHHRNKKVFIAGTKSKDWLVRESALKALLKTSTAEEQKSLMPVIKRFLLSSKTSTKNIAIKNLKIRNEEIIKLLKKLILSPQTGTSTMKLTLEKLTGTQFDEETENALRKLLFHRNKKIRILSLRALKKNKELKEARPEN